MLTIIECTMMFQIKVITSKNYLVQNVIDGISKLNFLKIHFIFYFYIL
jgi:hypothetical protein